MNKKRVAVAMSAGVDSSVAAALLIEQGYEVIGLTMSFDLIKTAGNNAGCGELRNINDAKQIAGKLGIRHYTLHMKEILNRYVIRDFCREYLCARTPNPCIRCNKYLKFGALLQKASSLGAAYLATGHYARISKDPKTKCLLLKKAADRRKDQSYFLYLLSQRQLRRILFPLGSYTKKEVISLAGKFNLAVADRKPSQEICFLAGSDYRAFLREHANIKSRPGPIIDENQNVIGRHKGVAFYTVGQREGLGICGRHPLYVEKIDPKHNLIIVGSRQDCLKSSLLVKKPHFVSRPVKKKVALRVRIRYNHKEVLSWAIPFKNQLRVEFIKPQFAITPGQSAVLYDRDTVVGGGIIDLES